MVLKRITNVSTVVKKIHNFLNCQSVKIFVNNVIDWLNAANNSKFAVTVVWPITRVKIKRANFLQYEYLNSSFIRHYFVIPFFFKPLFSNCISLPQS